MTKNEAIAAGKDQAVVHELRYGPCQVWATTGVVHRYTSGKFSVRIHAQPLTYWFITEKNTDQFHLAATCQRS